MTIPRVKPGKGIDIMLPPRNSLRDMPASSASWKRIPFTDGVSIPYRAAFDADQFARLKTGLIPRVMEDKWFIYYEEPHLFLHRSWTGLPVYRLTLKNVSNGVEVTEALRSIALDDISPVNSDNEAELVDFLVSNLLLGQAKPFPVPPGLPTSPPGLVQHSFSGTGFPESPGKPKDPKDP
jgi:hypothetical protein